MEHILIRVGIFDQIICAVGGSDDWDGALVHSLTGAVCVYVSQPCILA